MCIPNTVALIGFVAPYPSIRVEVLLGGCMGTFGVVTQGVQINGKDINMFMLFIACFRG